MKRIVIVYHKNCMDGLAAAYITKEAIQANRGVYFHYNEMITKAVQYGEEQSIFDDLNKDDIFYFVDFSLKREQMKELAKKVAIINVLDHHKTAEKELEKIEDEIENITIIFDMNKCGATLCYDYFFSLLPNAFPRRELFEYIEDRNLWKWQLENSKEISAGLKWLVLPNDIEYFKEIAQRYPDEKNKLEYIGKILLSDQDQAVNSKIKRTQEVVIKDVTFRALNATENISEIGNAICQKYSTPALIFFFTEKSEVVCSLRSLDELEDVSIVAKSFGGGGHRNACGFTVSPDSFYTIFYGSLLW